METAVYGHRSGMATYKNTHPYL